MLEYYFFYGIEKYLDHNNYTVWKFPAPKKTQERPLLYVYSFVTRAYGNYFDKKSSLITYFNQKGFDVYLVDWGKPNSAFSLSGWGFKEMTHEMGVLIDRLIEEYKVEKLNLFAICIGGILTGHLLSTTGDQYSKKIHRLGFYGVPLIGKRDLGVEKALTDFYYLTMPFHSILLGSGIPLNILNILLMKGISFTLLKWTWEQFLDDGVETFWKIILWVIDDRYVPYDVFREGVEIGFIRKDFVNTNLLKYNKARRDIHFLNIVGENDLIVKPSASIYEDKHYGPAMYKSFKQMIIKAGHFMFARPGFEEEKHEIANWFAGEDFYSLVHKYKTICSKKYSKPIINLIKRKTSLMNIMRKKIFIRNIQNKLNHHEDHLLKNMNTLENFIKNNDNCDDIADFLSEKIGFLMPYTSDIKKERIMIGKENIKSRLKIDNSWYDFDINDISLTGIGLTIINENKLKVLKEQRLELIFIFDHVPPIPAKAQIKWKTIKKKNSHFLHRLGLYFSPKYSNNIKTIIKYLKNSKI